MKKTSIIYWSGTGNTQMMAEAIKEGAVESGKDAKLMRVEEASIDNVKEADIVFLGCPSMGAEVLDETMEDFVESIKDAVSGKTVGLFGSYDWGDGQWMRDWNERMEEYGAKMISEGLILHTTPEDDGLSECKDFGKSE